MQVAETVIVLRTQVAAWQQQGLSVSFVPTMGNLHEGHLSLVRLAKEKCDKVVVSIFVNPLQFGVGENYETYPKTYEADVAKLQTVNTDIVFLPSVNEIYPNKPPQIVVSVSDGLTSLLEGASRPRHFDGVSTVVCKLFNIVQPDVAIFGQKDFQQFIIIKAMVADLAMPIEIIAAPTMRAVDGLALSSRNQYLTITQRAVAPNLIRVLQDIAVASGHFNYSQLCHAATGNLIKAGFGQVDYVQVCDALTLLPAINIKQDEALKRPGLVILAAVRLGSTRLIDNIVL